MNGRAERELEDAHKIAQRRSGARGADARKALLAAEARLVATQARYDLRLESAQNQKCQRLINIGLTVSKKGR